MDKQYFYLSFSTMAWNIIVVATILTGIESAYHLICLASGPHFIMSLLQWINARRPQEIIKIEPYITCITFPVSAAHGTAPKAFTHEPDPEEGEDPTDPDGTGN